LLAVSVAFAQTASLTGRVTDPSGAIVPQAAVTVQSVDSSVSTTVQSNEQGYYNFPSLLPGSYNLSVSKAGFKPVRQTNLELAVQQAARVDLTLEVGAVTETVDVSAQAVLLDSESSTVGQVVGTKQIAELPLLGRNPYALGMLVPGVRQAIADVLENGTADGSAAERDEELGRVRAYLGDYHLASTPALHELAATVVSHGGYPFGVA